MRYVSTRGEAPAIGFLDAVLAGLAPDGGLYVPQEWPSFTSAEIAAFDGKPYAEVAAAVIGKFAGPDIEAEDLLEMTRGGLLQLHPPLHHAGQAALSRHLSAGAVPRPDLGLQGRGHADPRPAV